MQLSITKNKDMKYKFLITFKNGETMPTTAKDERSAIKGMKSFCEIAGWEIQSARQLSKYPTIED